jgi:hypothetical protein
MLLYGVGFVIQVGQIITVQVRPILRGMDRFFLHSEKVFKCLRVRLLFSKLVIPAEAGIQMYSFLVSGFPFSRE